MTLLKRDSQKTVFQEISDICKNTYFKEPPQRTDSAIYQFYRYATNTKLRQLVQNIFLLKVLPLLLTYHDKYFLFLVIWKSIIVLMKRSILTYFKVCFFPIFICSLTGAETDLGLLQHPRWSALW